MAASPNQPPSSSTEDFFRRRDTFRKHPMLNNNLRRAFPGLGIASVAFAVYLFAEGMSEKLSPKKSSSH